MCGICGIVTIDGAPLERQRLESMNATLHHRGPDDEGIWLSDGGRERVGLAHRRLSIVDLSAAGHQPMTNEDGTIWLTYNGEIYNHVELRRELERAGHRYRSHTDSETIIHAYEEWGDSCVTRFRGMFAFALWDGPRRRLFVARDRLGIKPVYYTHRGSSFAFASEIKAILRSGLVDARLANGAIPEYLMFGYRAGTGTMFGNVERLPPGHVLTWEDGRVNVERYWQLKFAPDRSASIAELQRRFLELFEESVRLRLMSDVPLGVFLSGGLDSSAIAAVMARQVPEPIKTFSVGYEKQYYSELSFARQVSTLIGSDHHEVILTADDFQAAMPALTWHEDEPLWGTASVALYFVSKLAADHVTVVLTGEGSDELFAGYDRYWMTELNARLLGAYRSVPRPARSAIRRLLTGGMLPATATRALGHTVVRHETLPDGLFFDSWFGIFPPEWQRRLAGPALRDQIEHTDVYAGHRAIYDESQAADLVDRLLYTDIQTNLVELLMKQDQMSMATSIESRVPFLDHKMAEFAATVPWDRKIRRRTGKHIVKEALADYLPSDILHRPKKGFPVPWDAWLRQHFAPAIEATLLDARARDRGWFNSDGVRQILDDHRAQRADYSRQIWTLWGLELWARIFLDGEVPARDTGRALTLQATAG